ncbi:MAG: UDP-N-acetylglucosamine 2-epimerase (non-hydrolyzing) [Candidatus Thermoplasmatota archaeon]|nr:UDP-N-acetylglucosamine 2-epimerase (non-hydrolyzing) [Candidatus Thermoplasmatota archaeon]
MKKIVTVIGARPQFVKAAVISRLISSEYSKYFSEILIHTGQHYDENMSAVFFEEMQIPLPDINLEIGSGPHGQMTGRMLEAIEKILLKEKPDFLLVYGDTNSTIAGALAASKLHIPVIHVEAGLRSFNMKMPEEQNRILTDHLSSYLFCPTNTAVNNLTNEGITQGVYKTGDIMLDASMFYRQKNAITYKTPEDFMLITLHRAENTDDPERLRNIVEALSESKKNGILPLHPRTKKTLALHGLEFAQNIRVVNPVSFFEMLKLEEQCDFIVTDSGGVQKEAYFFQKACITMRDQTEWIETIESGSNVLVGADKQKILQAILDTNRPLKFPDIFGNGNSGYEILDALK